jgi:uncharacterized membrane protein YbjE (DUF340 family)
MIKIMIVSQQRLVETFWIAFFSGLFIGSIFKTTNTETNNLILFISIVGIFIFYWRLIRLNEKEKDKI